jgi:hypothetical protein
MIPRPNLEECPLDHVLWPGGTFLSLDDSGTFKAMVPGIPGDSKDCPKRERDRLIRTYDGQAWKLPCDVIVRSNGH